MKQLYNLTATLALLFFITACGGGGGGSNPPPDQLDPAVWNQGNWDNVNWQ